METLTSFRRELPDSTTVLVLGILSIMISSCIGIGVILGIVALSIYSKANKLYLENPQIYTSSSRDHLNIGRICAIVGICLSALVFLFFIGIIFLTFILNVFNLSNW